MYLSDDLACSDLAVPNFHPFLSSRDSSVHLCRSHHCLQEGKYNVAKILLVKTVIYSWKLLRCCIIVVFFAFENERCLFGKRYRCKVLIKKREIIKLWANVGLYSVLNVNSTGPIKCKCATSIEPTLCQIPGRLCWANSDTVMAQYRSARLTINVIGPVLLCEFMKTALGQCANVNEPTLKQIWVNVALKYSHDTRQYRVLLKRSPVPKIGKILNGSLGYT